jgi:DNA-binding MarR family transcriptional regulator
MALDEHCADIAWLLLTGTRAVAAAEASALRPLGLALWDYRALVCLARGPAATQLDLAEALRYDPGRLVSLLDSLEQRGFAIRVRDPDDRRARKVAITSEGAKRLAAARPAIDRAQVEALAGLDGGERTALTELLVKLIGCESHQRASPVDGHCQGST